MHASFRHLSFLFLPRPRVTLEPGQSNRLRALLCWHAHASWNTYVPAGSTVVSVCVWWCRAVHNWPSVVAVRV